MTIHERIKQRRKECGLTADEVAAELGVSRATVYRYESAEISNMGVDKIEPLARVLHTTPEYLMGWDDDPIDYDDPAITGEIPLSYMEACDHDVRRAYAMMKAVDEGVWQERAMQSALSSLDPDLAIIQRERSKMTDKEKAKLMNILKANFDDYNWDADDSGDIE